MKYASHGDGRDAVGTVDGSNESCDTSRRRVKLDVLVVVKNVWVSARDGVTEAGICTVYTRCCLRRANCVGWPIQLGRQQVCVPARVPGTFGGLPAGQTAS